MEQKYVVRPFYDNFADVFASMFPVLSQLYMNAHNTRIQMSFTSDVTKPSNPQLKGRNSNDVEAFATPSMRSRGKQNCLHRSK